MCACGRGGKMRRGMCGACYKRWLQKQPGSLRKPVAPEAERFWLRANKLGPLSAERPDLGRCWLWTGYIMPNGYGQFAADRRAHCYAHRWSWQEANGLIADDLTVDHLCLIRPCVNPSHMELVTRGENTRRGQWPVECRFCRRQMVPANLQRHVSAQHGRVREYGELRSQGLSRTEAAGRMGISLRTAGKYGAALLLGETP
jgi:HNH endonuclease